MLIRKLQHKYQGRCVLYKCCEPRYCMILRFLFYVVRSRFHHTSFLCGQTCQAAGTLFSTDGRLQRVDPHSGHYRPDSFELRRLLKFLVRRGIRLDGVQVDMQRVLKMVRDKSKKKIETPMLWSGIHAFSFLQHKNNARQIIADLSGLQHRKPGQIKNRAASPRTPRAKTRVKHDGPTCERWKQDQRDKDMAQRKNRHSKRSRLSLWKRFLLFLRAIFRRSDCYSCRHRLCI
jgi:hypothetical protein